MQDVIMCAERLPYLISSYLVKISSYTHADSWLQARNQTVHPTLGLALYTEHTSGDNLRRLRALERT